MAYYGNSNFNLPSRRGYGYAGTTGALGDPQASVQGISGYPAPSGPRGVYANNNGYNYLAGYNGNRDVVTGSSYYGGFSGYSGYPARYHQGALGQGFGHSGFENQVRPYYSNVYSPKGSYYGWGDHGLNTGIGAFNSRRDRLGAELNNTTGQYNLRDSLFRLGTDNQVDWILRRY